MLNYAYHVGDAFVITLLSAAKKSQFQNSPFSPVALSVISHSTYANETGPYGGPTSVNSITSIGNSWNDIPPINATVVEDTRSDAVIATNAPETHTITDELEVESAYIHDEEPRWGMGIAIPSARTTFSTIQTAKNFSGKDDGIDEDVTTTNITGRGDSSSMLSLISNVSLDNCTTPSEGVGPVSESSLQLPCSNCLPAVTDGGLAMDDDGTSSVYTALTDNSGVMPAEGNVDNKRMSRKFRKAASRVGKLFGVVPSKYKSSKDVSSSNSSISSGHA